MKTDFSIFKHALCSALLTVLLLGQSSQESMAQNAEDDLQNWTVITLQGPIHQKWLGYLEVQPRIGANLSEVDRLILRTAVGYPIGKHTSLWQGYAWAPVFVPTNIDEQRLFQQLLMTHRYNKLDITNRTRLEERFIEGFGETAYRLRHMLRLSHPVGKSEKWYVVGYEEAFFNLNTAGALKSGFDQNRTFLGVGRQLTPHTRLEGGYMANFVDRLEPGSDRLNHVILIQLMTNF